jgi:hypothetical protein
MKLLKEIKSKQGVVFFRRYHLFSTPWFHCWIHHIFRADEDRHLHDHPWNFFGVVLKGGYIEETEKGLCDRLPFSINYGRHTYTHKIAKVLSKKTVTLFFVGRETYDWGYHVDGKIVPNANYREMKSQGLV